MFWWIVLGLVIFILYGNSFPFVYHIRLGFTIFRALKLVKRIKIDEEVVHYGFATLDDIDWNFHINNASYARLFDMCRIDWFVRTGLAGKATSENLTWGIGGIGFSYRREIPVFKVFRMVCRLHSVGPKWCYVEQRFEDLNGRAYAIGYAKMVLKLKKDRSDVSMYQLYPELKDNEKLKRNSEYGPHLEAMEQTMLPASSITSAGTSATAKHNGKNE